MPLIARLMKSTKGPPGADCTQVGPMLAPLTLLSGAVHMMNHTDEFVVLSIVFDILKNYGQFYEKNAIKINGK